MPKVIGHNNPSILKASDFVRRDGTKSLTGDWRVDADTKILLRTSEQFIQSSTSGTLTLASKKPSGNIDLELQAGTAVSIDLSGLAMGTNLPIRFDEHSSAPGTPASGNIYVYGKLDGRMYSKDDAGQEIPLGTIMTFVFDTNGLYVPGASSEQIMGYLKNGGKLLEVKGYVDAGDWTFNIELRSDPHTSGTDSMASDLVADTNGEAQISFTNHPSAGDWLVLVASAVGFGINAAAVSITVLAY